MSRYEEYANSLILSEYVLSLTGDPEYAENLEANRTALAAIIAGNAADIAFMSSVVDSIYKACAGKHDDRNAVCDAFLSECDLLGVAQAGFIMDMGDALYEMATSEKHDIYDGLTEEPASDFLRGVVMLCHKTMLRLCLSLGICAREPAFLKQVTQRVKAYSAEDVLRYGEAALSFFVQ